MDIKATITLHLKDETWQFSELLGGRQLDEASKNEIAALIMSDIAETVFCNPNEISIEEDV